jgi:hypothetical protein
MSSAAHTDHSHADHHDHTPGFFTRWFCSTNHKDIGTLYIIFSIIAGIIGGIFSMLMRLWNFRIRGCSTLPMARCGTCGLRRTD